MGILDKIKHRAKSGMESAKISAKERRDRRTHLKGIEQKEKLRQEENFRKFKIQEEYRQKRKNIRSGGSKSLGGFSLDGLILGNTGGGRGGGDPLSNFILGTPANPKREKPKRKKKKKKTQPQIIYVIQEPKKRRRRRRKK